MPFCTPKASDLVLVSHSDTQVHSSTELKRATVSVFLTGGLCFGDELEYMRLNPRVPHTSPFMFAPRNACNISVTAPYSWPVVVS